MICKNNHLGEYQGGYYNYYYITQLTRANFGEYKEPIFWTKYFRPKTVIYCLPLGCSFISLVKRSPLNDTVSFP